MNSVLVILILPNLWATWSVARRELPQRRKALLILGTWFIPIDGYALELPIEAKTIGEIFADCK